jgi:hypothetical protein
MEEVEARVYVNGNQPKKQINIGWALDQGKTLVTALCATYPPSLLRLCAGIAGL